MLFQIKQPESNEDFKHYYNLRWQILRAPWKQPAGSELDEVEDECFHVMAVTESEIIGVARLQYNSKTEAQIRYMAVAHSCERQGVGRELLSALEHQASASSCNRIILDAREPAVGFYEKLGYTVIEKSYLLFDEIQHFRMNKDIQPAVR